MAISYQHGLIKIVGVFSYDRKRSPNRLVEHGYSSMHLVQLPSIVTDRDTAKQKTKDNYKDTYYAEFRDFMFTGEDREETIGLQKKQIRTFERKQVVQGNFIQMRSGQEKIIPFECHHQELYLFPDDVGIFSMTLAPAVKTMEAASDLINQARSFESEVEFNGKKMKWHAWVSHEILGGIPLKGDKVELDEYSGSKFKVYSVFDIVELSSYNRDHLLYEMGTCSMIGTMSSINRNTPSPVYYEELMQNKVSAFANYEGLALLDSFTVIGHENYVEFADNNPNYYSHHTWNRIYFGIYVYNLFVRYSLFKFNAQFLSNPVKYRDKFQDYLNHYNFKHIAFNFLPNLIFDKIRIALGIEDEIETFEKRLGNLAASIQEQQEKRQAFLLTIISVISAFDAAESILESVGKAQEALGWPAALFYPVLVVLIIAVAVFLVKYLFPLLAEKIEHKVKKILGPSK
jgi:hypothetical protein